MTKEAALKCVRDVLWTYAKKRANEISNEVNPNARLAWFAGMMFNKSGDVLKVPAVQKSGLTFYDLLDVFEELFIAYDDRLATLKLNLDALHERMDRGINDLAEVCEVAAACDIVFDGVDDGLLQLIDAWKTLKSELINHGRHSVNS